ncbi:T9SS type A sorting domain-containing protein [Dyadobacter diqingensis]|uniref:T9SS type A sorting domain-containing protein n=1 Tax=Dyadobacter diqingensis TaxID=2938121 RepID=UPI0020C1A891|nr:T9SS type A sorting domain-containing protein [Dyadobacter diqingensis]
MKLKTLLLAWLCLLGYASIGQITMPQVVPTYNYEGKLCSYTETKIPVQILGKFNDDNRFSVELLSYDYKPLGSYDAELKNGNLVFTIGGDLAENYSRIDYRISTTSPATKTTIYSNNWYTRGKISIARPAGDSDTLNAGMSYLLNVGVDANNPVTITFSDSSVREIARNGYQQTTSLLASKSTDIFIVKAVNSCNVPVPFSGKVPLVINPMSIIPVKVNSQTALCEGNEIELNYAVSGGILPESATFRLRIFKPYANSNEKQIFEVPATRKSNGVLVARIPEKITTYSGLFNIAVLVDKPALVSSYLKSVSIYEKPVASFRSQSDSARIGEPFTMWLNVAGPEPYTVELNNGVSYALDGNRNINIYPLKTETFSIRSLRTACGITTDLPKQTVIASLPPGITINSPSDQKWSICENQKLRLPFVTNATLNTNTKITVEGRTYNNTTYQFEAKIVNDSIEFLIPHSPAEWITEGYFNIKYFRIKTSNPTLISQYKSGFNIKGIPRVAYLTNSSLTLNGKGFYTYSLVVSGGTPYTVIDEKGTKSSADYVPMFQNTFVPATGAYGPKSVQNGCYANSDLDKLNLTVNPSTSQAPAIVVHPPAQKYHCDSDSVEVFFEALGKFDEGNEFQITRGDNPGAILLTVSKPGRYKIPASVLGSGYISIQVRSTRPATQVISGFTAIIDSKPVLLYPGELSGSTAEKPRKFAMDQTPSIYMQNNSYSPYTAEFTDGSKDYHFEQVLQYDSFLPIITKSKVTAYTLKSMNNVCGTTNVNMTMYLYWIGYSISLKYFQEDKSFCTGQQIVVPFNIERGSAPAGTTYQLQVGRVLGDYKTIASNTSLEDFKYIIPESMEGEYYVRIVTDAGIESGGKRFFVNKTPTGTISLSNQLSAEIDYGQTVYIDYNLTGGGPWEIIQNEQGNMTASALPFTRSYTLTQGTVFQLRSISNQCGYGSVSGSIAVRVKPRIVTFQPEKNNACNGEPINVRYQVGGDIPTGEKVGFYLKNTNGTRFELLSLNAITGTASLPIPATIPGGYYELICYITGSNIFESRQISIYKTSDIELIGNTTINQGESTYLQIRSTNAGNVPLDITLSDGTKSTFPAWEPGSHSYVMVTPATSTTYSIRSATGSCGNARSSGSATVRVNAASVRTVRVTGLNKINPFCEKDTLLVYYSITGAFSADNQFTVQFYDSQAKLVNSLPATGKESPLRVLIPAGFSTTEPYRIRIAASDPNTGSSDFPQISMFGTKANASFTNSNAVLDDKGNAKAVVLLAGTGPWRYNYGNDLGAIQRYASTSPDTLIIASKEPSAYFKLLSVTNGCGTGTINEPSTIRVEIILGTEEPGQGAEPITFGPNPNNGRVMLHFKTGSTKRLALYNTNGVLIWAKTISETDPEINMQQYPSGSYLLKITHSKTEQTLRIVKE